MQRVWNLNLPGYLVLHLKLLYDRCKGVRDDQDHDPNAQNAHSDAKKDTDADADEDADEDVDGDDYQ